MDDKARGEKKLFCLFARGEGGVYMTVGVRAVNALDMSLGLNARKFQ
jgi:hypothetical protein